MDLLTSLTSRVINKAMDGLAKRQVAISSNLANADTPHYRRRDVAFEGALAQAMHNARQDSSSLTQEPASNDTQLPMQATRLEHFAIGLGPQSIDDVGISVSESPEDLRIRNDGNSVDLENEMAQNAKNTQKYVALANIEGRRDKALKNLLNNG